MIELFKKFIIPYVFNDVKIYLSIIAVFFFTLIYSFCENNEFHGWINSSKYIDTDEKNFLSEVFNKYRLNSKNLSISKFLKLPIISKENKFYLVNETNQEINSKENLRNKKILFNIFDKGQGYLSIQDFLKIPLLLEENPDFSASYKTSYPFRKKQPTAVSNIFDRFYFSVIIQSNLGLGDIFPASRRVRLIMILQVFVAYFIIVVPLHSYKIFS